MSHRLWQAWRGTLAQVLGVTPADGEPLWDNVTKRLRIGDGSTAGGLRVVMKADKDAADYGLSFEGVVTTYTDTTHFKVSTLAGFGAEFFKPTAGAPYEIFVVQADNAAPEGEQTSVVAYATADGTFEHAAFSVPLAVGDIVLIIHPLIASLGTKATAAAAGAVTTTDYAMAYIKQIINELLGTDGAWTNLSNAAVASLDVALQAMGRVLAIDGANQFSGSLDGSARTTLEAMWVALGVLLGTRADAIPAMTAAPGTLATLPLLKAILERIGVTPADPDDSLHTILGQRDATTVVGFPGTNAALPILKGLQVWQGGFVYGDITGYTDTKNFASTTLAGFESGFFNGWTCFLAKDDAGAGATPQGARAIIDTFTTSTGAIVLKTALPAAGAVGDHIILVHPILLDAWNMRGGARSLETLGVDQDAELDVDRGTSGAVTVDGGEDDLYDESSDTEFVLLQLMVDMNNLAEGDSITFKIYTTEDGTERKISEDGVNTFIGVQDPPRQEIIGSGNEVWGREGIRVCAVKNDGTSRAVTAYWRDAKRGS